MGSTSVQFLFVSKRTYRRQILIQIYKILVKNLYTGLLIIRYIPLSHFFFLEKVDLNLLKIDIQKIYLMFSERSYWIWKFNMIFYRSHKSTQSLMQQTKSYLLTAGTCLKLRHFILLPIKLLYLNIGRMIARPKIPLTTDIFDSPLFIEFSTLQI